MNREEITNEIMELSEIEVSIFMKIMATENKLDELDTDSLAVGMAIDELIKERRWFDFIYYCNNGVYPCES